MNPKPSSAMRRATLPCCGVAWTFTSPRVSRQVSSTRRRTAPMASRTATYGSSWWWNLDTMASCPGTRTSIRTPKCRPFCWCRCASSMVTRHAVMLGWNCSSFATFSRILASRASEGGMSLKTT